MTRIARHDPSWKELSNCLHKRKETFCYKLNLFGRRFKLLLKTGTFFTTNKVINLVSQKVKSTQTPEIYAEARKLFHANVGLKKQQRAKVRAILQQNRVPSTINPTIPSASRRSSISINLVNPPPPPSSEEPAIVEIPQQSNPDNQFTAQLKAPPPSPPPAKLSMEEIEQQKVDNQIVAQLKEELEKKDINQLKSSLDHLDDATMQRLQQHHSDTLESAITAILVASTKISDELFYEYLLKTKSVNPSTIDGKIIILKLIIISAVRCNKELLNIIKTKIDSKTHAEITIAVDDLLKIKEFGYKKFIESNSLENIVHVLLKFGEPDDPELEALVKDVRDFLIRTWAREIPECLEDEKKIFTKYLIDNKNSVSFFDTPLGDFKFPSEELYFPWELLWCQHLMIGTSQAITIPKELAKMPELKSLCVDNKSHITLPNRLPSSLEQVCLTAPFSYADEAPAIQSLIVSVNKEIKAEDVETLQKLSPGTKIELVFHGSACMPENIELIANRIIKIIINRRLDAKFDIPKTITLLNKINFIERAHLHNNILDSLLQNWVKKINYFDSGWNEHKIAENSQEPQEKLYDFLYHYQRDPEGAKEWLIQQCPKDELKIKQIFQQLAHLREWLNPDQEFPEGILEKGRYLGQIPCHPRYQQPEKKEAIAQELARKFQTSLESQTMQIKSEVGKYNTVAGFQRFDIKFQVSPELYHQFFQAYELSYAAHPKEGDLWQRHVLEMLVDIFMKHENIQALTAIQQEKVRQAFLKGKIWMNENDWLNGKFTKIDIKTSWYDPNGDKMPVAESKRDRAVQIWYRGYS